MIKVTKINKHEQFWVNEKLLEFMEETPDTILSMASGRKIAVAETAEEVIALIAHTPDAPIVLHRMDEGQFSAGRQEAASMGGQG